MNKPLEPRNTFCCGDDADAIVTMVEQARLVESKFALASLATTCVLLGGLLLAMTSMADGATPLGGAVVFAQAT